MPVEGLTRPQLILRGIAQIILGDKKRLDEVLGGQGWRYLAGAICIFPITLIKIVDFCFRNPHLFYIRKHAELTGIGLSNSELKHLSTLLFMQQLDAYESRNEPEPVEKVEVPKTSALSSLSAKFDNNLTLSGKVLRTDGEEQRITFGNMRNSELKTVFPLLTLKKLRSSDDTYFVLTKDGVFELEAKLRVTFMKPVTIVLKRSKSEE